MSDSSANRRRQREAVQTIYNQDSDYYRTSQPHARSRSLARAAELLSPVDGILLDIATGAGHTAFAMAESARHVIASDLTLGMLLTARRQRDQLELANTSLLRTDAEAIAIRHGSVDWLSVRIAPHHFEDPERFLREARRVLRPGGRMIFVDNIAPERSDLESSYNDFERLRDPSHRRCVSHSELESWFSAAALTILHRETLRKPIDFDRWANRPNVDAATAERLRQILLEGSPGLRDWLKPRVEAGRLIFDETEAIVLAEPG